jgi:hypothetical protein
VRSDDQLVVEFTAVFDSLVEYTRDAQSAANDWEFQYRVHQNPNLLVGPKNDYIRARDRLVIEIRGRGMIDMPPTEGGDPVIEVREARAIPPESSDWAY